MVSLFMQVVQPLMPLAVRIDYGSFRSVAHIIWFELLVAMFFSAGRVRDRILAVRH